MKRILGLILQRRPPRIWSGGWSRNSELKAFSSLGKMEGVCPDRYSPTGDRVLVGMKQCVSTLGNHARTLVLELGDSSLNICLASTLC
jgi:hypothetical protein